MRMTLMSPMSLATAQRTHRSNGMLVSDKRQTPAKRSWLAGLLLSSALVAFAGQALALEPEHEIRRLMLAAEAAVQADNWAEAGEFLNRLQADRKSTRLNSSHVRIS